MPAKYKQVRINGASRSVLPKSTGRGEPASFTHRVGQMRVTTTSEAISGGGAVELDGGAISPASSQRAWEAIRQEALQKHGTEDLMRLDEEENRRLVRKAFELMRAGSAVKTAAGPAASPAPSPAPVRRRTASPARRRAKPVKEDSMGAKILARLDKLGGRLDELESRVAERPDVAGSRFEEDEQTSIWEELVEEAPAQEPPAQLAPPEPSVKAGNPFASLGIPGLSEQPGKPLFRVDFDLGEMGLMSTHYHWVSVHGSLLILVYDRRFEHGALYTPPFLGLDRTIPVVVHLGDEERRFQCYSCGGAFPHGFQHFVQLIISQQQPAAPAAEPVVQDIPLEGGNTWRSVELSKPV